MVSNFIVLCMPHNGKWTTMSSLDKYLTCAHSQDEIGFINFGLVIQQQLGKNFNDSQIALGQNIIVSTLYCLTYEI